MSPALTNEERTVLLQNTGDDNERSAYVITMFLQTIIASHDEHLSKPLHENFLLNLYSYVNEYIKAYNDIHQMLDTGLPFPVVQVRCSLSFSCLLTYSFYRSNLIMSYLIDDSNNSIFIRLCSSMDTI